MNIQLSAEIYRNQGEPRAHRLGEIVCIRRTEEITGRRIQPSLREIDLLSQILSLCIGFSEDGTEDGYWARIALTVSATWFGSVTGREQRSATQTKAALPDTAFNLSWTECEAGRSVFDRARSTTRST